MEKVFFIKDYKRKKIIEKYILEEENYINDTYLNDKEIKLINSIISEMSCVMTKRSNYLELMQNCKKNKINITYKDAKNILNFKKINNNLNKKSYHAFLKLKNS